MTAIFVFKELFPAVVAALEAISGWPGGAGGKAAIYLKAVDNSFLIAVEVLNKVLSVTKPLSVRLQGESQDLFRATESVQDCIAVLKDMRSDDTFYKLFADVETSVRESRYKCHASFMADNDMDKTLRHTHTPRNSSSETCSFLSLTVALCSYTRGLNAAFRQVSRMSSLITAFTCGQPFDSLIDGISLYRYVHV